ncbi:hypothetical protein NG796_22675 [Laspinema sp. A4]|uniref:hypothetical protein n=1 Tax=Laspinema sp. D2d TaxID=2953686 RepID=UPI0021BAC833|nr:hypothetical protein [Laspinema sp. D2d]MCT7986086.1 hypothetical protein [Laspinema sp. D2d]
MFDLICEFSRTHCIAICAFLVPANLLATLQTLIFMGLGTQKLQIRVMAAIASFYAVVMVLHVLSWFLIGVVMAPTYILLALASLCLSINVWAIAHSPRVVPLLRRI